MHIEPIMPQFDYVTIRRTGGFAGVNQELRIDKDMRATVIDPFGGDRHFELDAFSSQELMSSLSTLARKRPKASETQGFDLFNYDIELSCDGKVYHISSVDLGADEALHGVMLAANRLIEGDPDPVHVMSLHTMSTTEA